MKNIFLLLFLLLSIPAYALTASEYNNQGDIKYEKSDYKGALEDYSKAIELNPNDADTYYKRGYIKSLNNDYKGAIADYDKAITLEPNAAIWYYNRGESKYALKDYQGAITDWQNALDLIVQHKSYLAKGEVSEGIIKSKINEAKEKLKK